jgi:hypothetical protein
VTCCGHRRPNKRAYGRDHLARMLHSVDLRSSKLTVKELITLRREIQGQLMGLIPGSVRARHPLNLLDVQGIQIGL